MLWMCGENAMKEIIMIKKKGKFEIDLHPTREKIDFDRYYHDPFYFNMVNMKRQIEDHKVLLKKRRQNERNKYVWKI